jgi:hypothetical protein
MAGRFRMPAYFLDQQQDHPVRYRDLPRADEARGQPE